METYDIVMITVLGLAVLFGAWKGFAWQIASLAAIFVSYLVAMRFRGDVAKYIQAESPWNLFVAMLVLYIATSLVVWIAFGFVRRFIEKFQLKDFDRHAGAVLGALKGAVLCMLITLFAVTLLGDRQKEAICRSKAGNYIARAINELNGVVPPEIHSVLDPYLDRFQQEMSKRNDAIDPHNQPYLNDTRVRTAGVPQEDSGGRSGGQTERTNDAHRRSGEGGASRANDPAADEIRRVTDALFEAARNGLERLQ